MVSSSVSLCVIKKRVRIQISEMDTAKMGEKNRRKLKAKKQR